MAMNVADAQKRKHALRQAREATERTARIGGTMTYTELVAEMTTKDAPNGTALAELLSTLSRQTFASGRRMISAVVVKADTRLPGEGFFSLAAELGIQGSDQTAVHQNALAEVHAEYRRAGSS